MNSKELTGSWLWPILKYCNGVSLSEVSMHTYTKKHQPKGNEDCKM